MVLFREIWSCHPNLGTRTMTSLYALLLNMVNLLSVKQTINWKLYCHKYAGSSWWCWNHSYRTQGWSNILLIECCKFWYSWLWEWHSFKIFNLFEILLPLRFWKIFMLMMGKIPVKWFWLYAFIAPCNLHIIPLFGLFWRPNFEFQCPTTIVPFFGDQFFWGDRIHQRGLGPAPIPISQLSVETLTDAIQFMLQPEVIMIISSIAHEKIIWKCHIFTGSHKAISMH